MLDVYIWNSKILIWGTDFSEKYHHHYPIQIIISKDNITASLKNGREIKSNVIIVGSNVEHHCKMKDKTISLFIDPETNIGKKMSRFISSEKLNSLPDNSLKTIIPSIFDSLEKNMGDFIIIKELFNKILSCYIDNDTEFQELDFRIVKVLNHIQESTYKKISISELASCACLSESRLMHLFKNSIGIPIRRYLLWKRLIDGLFLLQRGEAFSYSAFESGFSDYSHFSRTFKSNFGTTLKKIFKDDRFIHVYVYNTI